MIEIKLKDLIASLEVLKVIAKKPLKGRVAFQLARIMRELEKEYASFQTTRHELIQKYAEKTNNNVVLDEEGNCKIARENIATFNKEMEELMETLIQLNVDYIQLEDIENDNFTPEQMYLLDYYIKK